MKFRKQRDQGFTLVEIMIVVAIIGLLAGIALPNFVRAREQSQTNACINNLRQIDSAAQTWALENQKGPSSVYTLINIQSYIKLDSTQHIPSCPGGGTYTPGASIAVYPTCSVANHKLP
jgi:prepilin-type N-terminal cleavage/methylation domain-containing protein